jgi:hypothetical protein
MDSNGICELIFGKILNEEKNSLSITKLVTTDIDENDILNMITMEDNLSLGDKDL